MMGKTETFSYFCKKKRSNLRTVFPGYKMRKFSVFPFIDVCLHKNGRWTNILPALRTFHMVFRRRRWQKFLKIWGFNKLNDLPTCCPLFKNSPRVVKRGDLVFLYQNLSISLLDRRRDPKYFYNYLSRYSFPRKFRSHRWTERWP